MANRALLRWSATIALAASTSAAAAETAALLPVRRAARRPEVEQQVERALVVELAARVELADADRTRDALRRRRLRSPDGADAEALRAVAAELEARWLIAAAVHEAPVGPAPELTLSARLYDGASGRLVWTGFVGANGLDGERLLGIGRLDTYDQLAEHAVAELLAPLATGGTGLEPPPAVAGAERLGTVAIVPFTATLATDGLEVSLTATESLREILARHGARLAEPACVRTGLRQAGGDRWGELTAEAREAIRVACGADHLLTGSIERWEIAGSGTAPEPVLAVAIRLLDATEGRILWTGSLEGGGWDRPGPFGLHRVYARGEWLERLLERIIRNLLAADWQTTAAMESSS
jgi:hypothetical protein